MNRNLTHVVGLTQAEERFYDLLVDYEITSMVKNIKCQVWVKTPIKWRRIDFVLIIDSHPNNRKGLYIEIDDITHEQPERMIDDKQREWEIYNPDFPLLRFDYTEIFNQTERVMNIIEGQIEFMRGV